MRRLASLAAGIALLLPAGRAGAVLYDTVLERVRLEQERDAVEPEVAAFVTAVLREDGLSVTKAQIRMALINDLTNLCKNTDLTQTMCGKLAERIRVLATREKDLRTFGRRLEALAAKSDVSVDLAIHQTAILNVWSTGTGVTLRGDGLPTLRLLTIDPADLEGELSAIGEALTALEEEARTAAVWRYQHGVRFVRGERTPGFSPPRIDDPLAGTERQYLLKRYDDVEAALLALWERILRAAAPLNLQKGEFALLRFPEEARPQGLPDNTEIWGRVDHDPTSKHPMGDVGLGWTIAMEPVMPSLTSEEDGAAILGGRFPPNPEDASGLCGHPIAARGYLCRPAKRSTGGVCTGGDEQKGGPGSITLTGCVEDVPARDTVAGPDVCKESTWYTPTPEDKALQCSVAVRCASTCLDDEGRPAPDEPWHTYGKDENGVVEICLRSSRGGRGAPAVPHAYDLVRALVFANDLCALPPQTDPFADVDKEAACCMLAGEANEAMCEAMLEDGVFGGAGGDRSSAGIPFTVQTCTEAFTIASCGNTCPRSFPYDQAFVDELSLKAGGGQGGADTCADLLENPDPRTAAMVRTIEERDDICRPGRTVNYRNSIGNHLCYVGACMEEASETRQLAGGRVPYGVLDEAFPWETEGLERMEEGLRPLTVSPDAGGVLPVYHPRMLEKAFDVAVCQAVGQPPRTPPELCGISAGVRHDLPLLRFFATSDNLLGALAAETDAVLEPQRIAAAIGARIGADLEGQYLRTALNSLADLLHSASDVLERMREQSTPGLLCPGTDDPPMKTTEPLPVPPLP